MNNMLMPDKQNIHHRLFLEFILVIAFLSIVLFFIYHPGLTGGFVLDDISNIMSPVGIAMQELTWEELKRAAYSMEHRTISRTTFGLNHLFFGFNPYYFKLVNIIIHLINSVLIFYIIKAITRTLINNKGIRPLLYSTPTVLALLISLAWAVHPINLTSVLYSVQRMNSLSALFVFAGMLVYIHGRNFLNRKTLTGFLLMIGAVLIFSPLSWYSKEIGAILPVFLFVLELTIFQFSVGNIRQKKYLIFFFIILLLLPALILLVYLSQQSSLLSSGYNNRDFSLYERLLTEARVIWSYIQMILLPMPSSFGLFQDDVVVSRGLSQPYSTLWSIIGLAGLLATAIFTLKKVPYLSFGILIFLSGHIIESTILPLELKYEHRNYLPSIGLIFPLFLFLLTIGKSQKHYRIGMTISLVLILLYSGITYFRANDWSNNSRLYLTEVHYHPDSPRANYEAGKYYGQLIEQKLGDSHKNYRMAEYYFSRETALRKNSTSGLFGIILVSIDSGVEVKQEWINELEYRLRTQPLEQVNILWLDRLTDCVSRSMCSDEQLKLDQLINASMANNNSSHRIKIMLYSIRAKYDYNIRKNIDDALVSARIAERISARNIPTNLSYKINLIQYMIWSNNITEARNILDYVRSHDNSSMYKKEIAALEKILLGINSQ